MANVGSLVVELSANIAKFQSDMGKAAAEAQKRAAEIDKSFGLVKKGLASIGVGFALGATFDKIKGKIEDTIAAAAGLQQLSEKTGSTVESLSGLVGVAKLSNTGTEELAGGLQKLAKAMVDAENGGKKTTAAFAAIGISAADLKNKSPADTFLLISNQLAKYGDGAEKVAIAQVLLGKAGANLLPVTKDLAIVGEYAVKTTKEQGAAADELEKNQIRLTASTNAIYKKIGLELIPVFDAFTKALLDTQTANGGVRAEVDKLAKDGSIREWAEDAVKVAGFVIDAFDGVVRTFQIVGRGIGATAAAGVAVAHGEFSEAKSIMSELGTDVDAILNKTLFSNRLAEQIKKSRIPAKPEAPLPKPDVSGLGNNNDKSYKGPKDDPAKKLMEGQVKAQEALMSAEKAQLATREQYLSYYFQQEYITTNDFYAQKKQLIQDSLQVQLDAFSREEAAINAYMAQTTREVDLQDARNKLADVAAKRTAAQIESSKRLTDVVLEQAKVYRDFELQTAAVAHQAKLNNDQAQFAIDLMGKGTLEVLKQTAAKQIDLALEQRIYDIKKKTGDDDVEANKQIAEATAQANEQKVKSLALVTAAYEKSRDAAFGASEAVRKYTEEAADNATQIEGVLTDAFKGAEDALVNFVTTGKLDFKSLANSIIADLARMAIKQQIIAPLANSLGLSQSGSGPSGGGLFGALAGMFGKGGGAAGGGLGAATATDVASAGDGLMFFAGGGDPPLNAPSVVGGKRPRVVRADLCRTHLPERGAAGHGLWRRRQRDGPPKPDLRGRHHAQDG
jgi:lambda family phage tail tape measure protein